MLNFTYVIFGIDIFAYINIYTMYKTLNKPSSSKLFIGIYVLALFILLVGMTFISYSLADTALYFELDNCNMNAITFLY